MTDPRSLGVLFNWRIVAWETMVVAPAWVLAYKLYGHAQRGGACVITLWADFNHPLRRVYDLLPSLQTRAL